MLRAFRTFLDWGSGESTPTPVSTPARNFDMQSPTSDVDSPSETRGKTESVESMFVPREEIPAVHPTDVLIEELQFVECTDRGFVELLNAAKTGNIPKIKFCIEKQGVDPTIVTKNYDDTGKTYYGIPNSHPPLSLSEVAKIYHQVTAGDVLEEFENTVINERITLQYFSYLESLRRDSYIRHQLKVREEDIIFPNIPHQFSRDTKEGKMKEYESSSNKEAEEWQTSSKKRRSKGGPLNK